MDLGNRAWTIDNQRALGDQYRTGTCKGPWGQVWNRDLPRALLQAKMGACKGLVSKQQAETFSALSLFCSKQFPKQECQAMPVVNLRTWMLHDGTVTWWLVTRVLAGRIGRT